MAVRVHRDFSAPDLQLILGDNTVRGDSGDLQAAASLDHQVTVGEDDAVGFYILVRRSLRTVGKDVFRLVDQGNDELWLTLADQDRGSAVGMDTDAVQVKGYFSFLRTVDRELAVCQFT